MNRDLLHGLILGGLLGAGIPLLIAWLVYGIRWWSRRARAGRLRDLRVVVALLILATFVLVAGADAQVVRLRSAAGSGGAATAVTPGVTTITGCTNLVLYGDGSGLFNCEAGFGYNQTTNTFIIPSLTNSSLTATRIPIVGVAGLIGDDADFTFSGTRATITDLTVTNFPIFSAGTSGRVPFFGAAGVLNNDAGLTYDGTTLESIDQTNISGPDSTTNVEIGSTANDANGGTGGTSVIIGNGAINNSNSVGAVAVGSLASSTGNSSVSIGTSATAAISGVAVGPSATAAASGIAIGAGGASAVANQFVAGSAATPMTNVWFGKGVTSTTATAFALNGTGGSGSDNAGADLILAAGRSTGSATPANILFQTSTAAGSSSTLQTLATRLTLSPTTFTSTLPVLFPDGTAGAPSIAWSSDNDGTGTGLYRPSANVVGVANDGVLRWQFATGSAFTPNADFNNTFGSATLRLKDVFFGNSIQGGNVKTLTETTATEFVRIAVPQTAGANYAGGTAIWTAYATDGTDTQSIQGESKFAAMNKAGTETCAAIIDSQTLAAASAGTLTCTITCVTGLTDLVGLAANCTSSLVQTTLSLRWRVDTPQANAVTPQ